MKNEQNNLIKITGQEILRLFLDATLSVEFIFTKSYKKRLKLGRILENNSYDRRDFLQKISRLKRLGYIEKYNSGKEKYLEITQRGIGILKNQIASDLTIQRPERWDGKWRIVMFDIPEKHHDLRNVFRNKLYDLGFSQVQKSVFVYPFECTKEINIICNHYGGREYIKFMIADIIEGETTIIDEFIGKNILQKSDLQMSHK